MSDKNNKTDVVDKDQRRQLEKQIEVGGQVAKDIGPIRQQLTNRINSLTNADPEKNNAQLQFFQPAKAVPAANVGELQARGSLLDNITEKAYSMITQADQRLRQGVSEVLDSDSLDSNINKPH